MTRWRLALAVLLVLLIGVPAVMPLVELARHPIAWRAWQDADRLVRLAGNTVLLVGFTLLIVMPVAVLLAALLYRTDLPGRGVLRRLMILALFIPLPLVTSSWQTAFGSGGWLPVDFWNEGFPNPLRVIAPDNAYMIWGQGFAAVWIHAMAGLPWAVLLCGLGFRWVERELEEDALTVASPWRVFSHVTLRRAQATVLLAALWVALQASSEITVTNMMQVRTYAEEVYVQMVRPELRGELAAEDLVARAVAVSIPALVLTGLIVFFAVRYWEKSLPPLVSMGGSALVFPLGRWRLPAFFFAVLLAGLVLGLPLASLVRRVGLAGEPPEWSWNTAIFYLRHAARVDGHVIGWSVLQGLLTGVCLTILALAVSWLTRRAPRFRRFVLLLLTVAWSLPGPVIGLGLKSPNGAIGLLLDVTHDPRWLVIALHRGPSPLPVLWVHLIRFFPCGLALLWPVVRMIPDELDDSAQVDGATPWQRLWHVVVPLALPACIRTTVAVLILSLGELSAGKLVSTAAAPTFADVLFTKMHFGVKNDLAAYCLLLLGVVIAAAAGLAAIEGALARWERAR